MNFIEWDLSSRGKYLNSEISKVLRAYAYSVLYTGAVQAQKADWYICIDSNTPTKHSCAWSAYEAGIAFGSIQFSKCVKVYKGLLADIKYRLNRVNACHLR